MDPRDADSANMLEKSLRLLQAFRRKDGPLRFAELVARTGMPKSTTHRLARELVRLRLLQFEDGRFTLGIAAFELGGLVPLTNRVRDAALPFMHDLFAATRRTVHLGVRDGLDVVYAEKLGAARRFDVPSRVGGRLPLTCTAVGKALLAHAGPDVIRQVLDAPLRRLTPSSVTDPGALENELVEIRSHGYAIEREESHVGGACVAAPILVNGKVQAAISIAVNVGEFEPQRLAFAVMTASNGTARQLASAAATDFP